MRALRAAVAALFAVVCCTAAAEGQDAESCGVCHRSVHQDWLQSRHSLAWKSETFQAQMKEFGSPEFCGRCHAAETIWRTVNMRAAQEPAGPAPTEYTPALRDIAEFRQAAPEDGVSCGTCHFVEVLWPTRTSGEFLGPYHSEAGHGGKIAAEFQSYSLCGTCHGRAQSDYTPKAASELTGFHHLRTQPIRFAAKDQDACGGCHMPQREERLVQLRVFRTLPERSVGEHTFAGNRYAELSSALTFTLDKTGAEPILVITNEKLGHPPQTSADTHYRLVLSRDGETSQTVELSGAAKLEVGQSLRIPLEFAPGESLRVDLVKRDGHGFEETLFRKTL